MLSLARRQDGTEAVALPHAKKHGICHAGEIGWGGVSEIHILAIATAYYEEMTAREIVPIAHADNDGGAFVADGDQVL